MKFTNAVAVIVITGTFGLLGCKPKETAHPGQIFIVTQDAQNIKLGAVEILLIDKNEVANYFSNQQVAIDTKIIDQRRALQGTLQELKPPNYRPRGQRQIMTL